MSRSTMKVVYLTLMVQSTIMLTHADDDVQLQLERFQKMLMDTTSFLSDELPAAVVNDFKKQYRGSDYIATLFPKEAHGVGQSVVTYPQMCLDTQSQLKAASILNTLVRTKNMSRTLEIGLACGASAATIMQGHADSSGSTRGKHIAIDPAALLKSTDEDGLQKNGFDGIGVEVIEKLGLSDGFELKPHPSHGALPDILRELGENTFQLVLVDGMHLFDFMLLEAYYADLLLDVGGYLVFDDTWMPATQRVIMFIIHNRHYSIVDTTFVEDPYRLTVLKKLKNDDRPWSYHKDF
eukprot:m.18412 g.18412  ORF g.18412 m.18412 type:complete len:294 (+) comp12001_c0_seq1:73-954(+)